jgi:late competence protein required for DNA uptake (superfamily II DNA/RNA helicase)
MQMPMFTALTRGYLSAMGATLTETEKSHLVFSGKLITLEIGIRFLTDYLEGDKYFKIKRTAHNLDRTRTQLKLVQSIEEQEEEMTRLAASLA